MKNIYNMNINFNSIRKLILCGIMLTAFVGIAVAQNDLGVM